MFKIKEKFYAQAVYQEQQSPYIKEGYEEYCSEEFLTP